MNGNRRIHGRRGVRPALVVLACVALAGCVASQPTFDLVGIATQDGPPGGTACPATAIEGMLALSPRTVLGVASAQGGSARDVLWPPGYVAARGAGGLLLLDQNSSVVARVGDRVRVGGEAGADGIWLACRPVVIPTGS